MGLNGNTITNKSKKMDKTPNDKLPEEIQEQIKNAAETRRAGAYNDSFARGFYSGEITGATAWAGWKVKHDELQAQAQGMADALEWIKTYGPCDSLTVNFIDKTLQQFKDGKGKGSVVGKCTKCGRHYPHANESGMCVKCGKEVGNGIH